MSRLMLSAAVFAGALAAGAFAANYPTFHNQVAGVVDGLTFNMVRAGRMLDGELHLADPTFLTSSDKLLDRIEPASVVTHVEVVGGGPKQRIVLLNPDGQEVFTHDPEQNTTIVAKDTIIPSVTLRDSDSAVSELRLVTAAPVIEAPEELRAALLTPDTGPALFYRDDL